MIKLQTQFETPTVLAALLTALHTELEFETDDTGATQFRQVWCCVTFPMGREFVQISPIAAEMKRGDRGKDRVGQLAKAILTTTLDLGVGTRLRKVSTESCLVDQTGGFNV